MRRQLSVLVALFGLLFSLLAAATPAQAAKVYPLPTHGNGQVSSSTVEPGGCVVFSGGGFKPGSPVVIADNGKTVRTVTADPNGNFSTRVCFDSNAAVGRHVLTGTGIGANGAARVVTAYVNVMGVSTGQPASGGGGGLPFTGFDLVTFAALGLGLVLSGAGMVARGARRRRPATA